MVTQRSPEARPVPPPARSGRPGRGASRQLALPLAPDGPPAPASVAGPLLAGGVPVRPGQVWVRLPPSVQAEVRRLVWQVLGEVIRHGRHEPGR
jgi:hypothetical protein